MLFNHRISSWFAILKRAGLFFPFEAFSSVLSSFRSFSIQLYDLYMKGNCDFRPMRFADPTLNLSSSFLLTENSAVSDSHFDLLWE